MSKHFSDVWNLRICLGVFQPRTLGAGHHPGNWIVLAARLKHDVPMRNTLPEDWSPADHPYAIAVSEAQWWLNAVDLTIMRMREGEERWARAFSSEQIDARQLIIALRQILTAEDLEQAALTELEMDGSVSAALAQARRVFEDALPGITHMRNALVHFEAWTRGMGRGPQKGRVDAGEAMRDAARAYSGFGYDHGTDSIFLGPHTITLNDAAKAAGELCQAIYAAANQVDRKNTADLRDTTVQALADAGIPCDMSEAPVRVSSGRDLRIWLSLRSDLPDEIRTRLPSQVIAALATWGLRLRLAHSQTDHAMKRLAAGDSLYVVQ